MDFGKLYNGRTPILKLAYSRFRNDRALNAFIKKNASWLEDFALYMALKETHGYAPWFQWEEKLKFRDSETLEEQKQLLEESLAALDRVEESLQMGMPEDFYSIDLMDAYEKLGRITGEAVDDDLADEIFAKFCMGK